MKKLHIAYSLAIASTLSYTAGSQLHQFGTKAEFTSETHSASISIKLSVPDQNVDKEIALEKKEPPLKKEQKKEEPASKSTIEEDEKEPVPPPEKEPPKDEPEVVEEKAPEQDIVEEPKAEEPVPDEPAPELPELENADSDEETIVNKE